METVTGNLVTFTLCTRSTQSERDAVLGRGHDDDSVWTTMMHEDISPNDKRRSNEKRVCARGGDKEEIVGHTVHGQSVSFVCIHAKCDASMHIESATHSFAVALKLPPRSDHI